MVESDFPRSTLGWVGTGCGGIPSPSGCPGTPMGMWLLCHGAESGPEEEMWMSAKLSCSTLCNELLLAPPGSARCCSAPCWAGWFAWGREEVKVPPANTAGVKACPPGTLVGVTAHLWPCVVVLRGLSGSCDLSCLLEAGDCALSALQPWGCAGVPASPCALESAEWLPTSSGPVYQPLGITFPVLVELGGVVCPCLGSISLTASCKPSWGRFLLRFLPLAMLPALGPGPESSPLMPCRLRVRMPWPGQRPERQVRGCGAPAAPAPVAGPEAKQGQAGSEAGWDTWAFPEVRQEAER